MPSTRKVEQYMARDLVTIQPDANAYEAIVLLLKHQISGMPVVDKAGELVGILSEKDCLKTLFSSQYHDLPTALVKDLMSTNPVTIGPDTSIVQAAELFLDNRFRRLPVLEDDRLVGQISRIDVLRAIRDIGQSE